MDTIDGATKTTIIMSQRLEEAQASGARGEPCKVYPKLTAETDMEEIKRKAGTILTGDSAVDALVRAFYINYMCAWQKGARAANPIPPRGVCP